MKYEYIPELMLFILIVLAALVLNSLGSDDIEVTKAIATVALILSGGSYMLSSLTIKQAQKIESTRRLERSLEMFYRPLQNFFNGHEDDPITVYDRIKYDDIGRYKHLAEPNTLRCFEHVHKQMKLSKNC